MLPTKALCNRLNALFAKLHHPPPLDTRESQRLLKTLTNSFRKNLDREHGFWLDDAHLGSLPASSLPNLTSTSGKGFSTSRDAHRRPTDRHVRAILSNPLFSYQPPNAAAKRPDERDPMDVFDQAVARGLMNPIRAAGVLVAKRQAIAQSASISVPQSMATSGTALRVLQWLRSSGLERDLTFLKTKSLLDALIPFMVEEGLEEAAWVWLERRMRGEGAVTNFKRHAPEASVLLSALVRAKVSPTGSLNNGYASIIRATDMFLENKNFLAAAISPWRILSVGSTVFAWKRSQPSEALFDSFAAMSDQFSKLIGTVRIDRAHLDLHHPTNPDATLAVRYLKSFAFEQLSAAVSAAVEAPALRTILARVILMATDATHHLVRAGREAEAAWVERIVQDKIGGFVDDQWNRGRPFSWRGYDPIHMFEPEDGSLAR